MNNTTVNYTPSLSNHSNLSTTTSPAALKQVAAQNAAVVTSAENTSAGASVKADQTSLSLASGLITKALSISDVRHEKVAGLQKAIKDGTYHVTSADVASKLLKSLLG